MNTLFECSTCRRIKTYPHDGIGTGYAITLDGNKVCYSCAAKHILQSMFETGKVTLYLDNNEVTDWSGELSFNVLEKREGRHNFAGVRYDFWFRTSDNRLWHGVTFGKGSQLAYCKRTKG